MGTVAPRWSPQSRWLVLWLVFAAVLVVRASSRPESRGVILDHLEFGRRLLHGENVYGPWQSDKDAPVLPLHAPYPPSFGLLTAPFSIIDQTLGTRAARCAWALLQMACLVAAALVLRARTIARVPLTASHWHWLWLATFLLGLRFLLRDTHGGGGNLINLALCLLAFDAAERDRPRRAGLWLGLSLATKPTQLWLLPVFLLLGRRRAVGWALLTGALATLLTLLMQRFHIGPWQRWIEGSWLLATQTDVFATPALDFPPFTWMNQSLRCAVGRFCGDVPPEHAAKVALGVVPGLGMDVATVAWLGRALSALLLGWLLHTAWRTRSAPAARLWVFAGALVLSVLLNPLSWKAHHMALLPVLLLMLQQAGSLRSRATWLVLLLWAICCLPGKELVGDDLDEWANSLYLLTAWDVALLAFALLAARSAAREHGESAGARELVEPGR